jgi:CHAT domain-containing protein
VLAPRYEGTRLEPLPFAQKERAFLLENGFWGVLPADRDGALAVLDQGLPGKPISLLHYAGHGEFGEDTAATSRILLEQESEILSLEIEDPLVHLGERDATLVFFNACRVGRTGVVLRGMGGWASAFASRGFRGFIGPLWSVDDEDAFGITRAFHELAVKQRVPIAESLRRIRSQHGAQSDTWLAYVFHGDVTATF